MMPARAGILGIVITVLAVVLAPSASPAATIPIPGVDFSTIAVGNLNQASMSSDFMTPDLTSQGGPGSSKIGSLVSTVYQNGTVFTYVLQVTPTVVGENRFTTQFLPALYNNMAGWDFTAAGIAAGVPGSGATAFLFNNNLATPGASLSSTNLGWTKNAALSGLWDGTDSVTLFFQSLVGPGQSTYGLAGTGGAGVASGYAPIATPEPTSLLLLAFGVVGTLAIASRRRGLRANRAA